MQALEEQGYLMHLWHGNAGAEQTECDSTTGIPDKNSKKVREYSH